VKDEKRIEETLVKIANSKLFKIMADAM